MGLISTADKEFLATLLEWLDGKSEILVMIRYTRAGGNKSFEFYTSFDMLLKRLRQLQPGDNVIAYRKPQLPLRGFVDDAFINKCLMDIPDGTEHLLVETVRRTAGSMSWFHEGSGETHEGFPPWPDGNPDVITAT